MTPQTAPAICSYSVATGEGGCPALPFAVRLPNAATREAMRAAERGEALIDDLND